MAFAARETDLISLTTGSMQQRYGTSAQVEEVFREFLVTLCPVGMPCDVIKPGGHQVFALGTPFPGLTAVPQADMEIGDVAPSPSLCKAHCSAGSLICSSPLPLLKSIVVLLLFSLYSPGWLSQLCTLELDAQSSVFSPVFSPVPSSSKTLLPVHQRHV